MLKNEYLISVANALKNPQQQRIMIVTAKGRKDVCWLAALTFFTVFNLSDVERRIGTAGRTNIPAPTSKTAKGKGLELLTFNCAAISSGRIPPTKEPMIPAAGGAAPKIEKINTRCFSVVTAVR